MWHSLIASGAAEPFIFLTTVLVTNGAAERRSEVILFKRTPDFPSFLELGLVRWTRLGSRSLAHFDLVSGSGERSPQHPKIEP